MTVGVYDTAVGVQDLNPKLFATQQAMLAEWTAGHLTGVVDRSCPRGGRLKHKVGSNLVVMIDRKISDGDLAARVFAASPELRDLLAQKIVDSGEIPADVGLLTQQQYLADPTCVDIYLTSFRKGSSSFLNNIAVPFYVKQLETTNTNATVLHAEQYPLSFNVAPVTVDSYDMSLYVSS